MTTRDLCRETLWLDVDDLIDHYSYHDAPSTLMFNCELPKDHPELHMARIGRKQFMKEIFWKRK